MAMSRKHYREVAEIIRAEIHLDRPLTKHDRDTFDDADAIYNIASALATMFKCDNSLFNRAQFMAACNIEE